MSVPLTNLGPAALQALLLHKSGTAEGLVEHLTPTEQVHLELAAQALITLTHRHTRNLCQTCEAPITWNTAGGGTRGPRWLHLGSPYLDTAHQGTPGGTR